MAISSVTSKVIYVGDAATATLAYPFKILAEGDLTVSRYVTLTSVASALTLNTDYAVTGVGVDAGGNVLLTGSYAGGMPTGSNTIIRRVVDLTQTVDYVENDPFPANTHENALDKLCMSTQQLQEQIDRAVLADISQTSVSYVDFQTQAGIATSSATVSVAQASTATVQATNAAASAVQASSSAASASGAGVALDNLVTTAINQSLLPGSSNYINIGSTTKVWNTANIATVAATLLTASTLRVSGTANFVNISISAQPCFQVRKSANQSNLITGSAVTITWETETFDIGSNFASNTFTAPSTGKYPLFLKISFGAFDTACTYVDISIVTSNRTYATYIRPLDFSADSSGDQMLSAVADMDTSDTAYVTVTQVGGAEQLDISSGNGTVFSGCLLF